MRSMISLIPMKSTKPPATPDDEIQVSVRLRGDDVKRFKLVKSAIETPNNLEIDNAEVLRSALRDKAKSLEVLA